MSHLLTYAEPARCEFRRRGGWWRGASCSPDRADSSRIGGIIAAVAFQQKDAPSCALACCRATIAEAFSDIPGLWTVIAGQIVIVAVSLVLMAWYKAQNRKADEGKCVPTNRPIALT